MLTKNQQQGSLALHIDNQEYELLSNLSAFPPNANNEYKVFLGKLGEIKPNQAIPNQNNQELSGLVILQAKAKSSFAALEDGLYHADLLARQTANWLIDQIARINADIFPLVSDVYQLSNTQSKRDFYMIEYECSF